MSDHNVRVPPDSTGKRLGHTVYLDIDFNSGTIAFQLGDTIVTPSGVSGTVIKIKGTTAVGSIYVNLDEEVPEATLIGETLKVGGVTYALTSSTGIAIYIPNSVLVSGGNPKNRQHVDNLGAASIRFAEGSPQFDAFGKLQVSNSHTLGDYVLRYDSEPGQFEDKITGTATIVHNQNFSGVVMTTGTTNGDFIQRTSHEYHTYQPGVSQVIEMTIAVGDEGKTNVTRGWGYGDDFNGVGFRLADFTFNCVNRSFSSGVMVNEFVPQSLWNGDRLDGSGDARNPSGFLLDVSKDNIYWIDLQWLGAGRVRYGVVINGVRITCHSDNNANNQPFSYMSTGSLPVRAIQFNTGAVASSSELKLFCCTVKTEGAYNPLRRLNSYDVPTITNVTSNTVPVTALAIRPREVFKGIDNRCGIYPQTFEIYNFGPDPVAFDILRNATEVGTPTWFGNADSNSATDLCLDMAITGGRSLRTKVIPPNTTVTVPFEAFSSGRQGLRRNATASTGYSAQYLSFRTLESAKTARVSMSMAWEEIRK